MIPYKKKVRLLFLIVITLSKKPWSYLPSFLNSKIFNQSK